MPRKRPRDDDYDDLPRRPRRPKRRRESNPTPWIVGGILGTLFLVGVVVTVVSIARKGGADGGASHGPAGDAFRGLGGLGGLGSRMVKVGDREFPEEMLINDAIMMSGKRDIPANWTHQDLAEFLRSKGIPVTIQPGLASPNGQGVWFVDARPNVAKRGRVRVYRCPSQRDAARQVVAMGSEWLPYVVGHFAVGFDVKENPSDDDLHFSTKVKGHLFQ